MNDKKIKAVRIVLGFTDDLRIRIPARREYLFDFLDNNRYGLFGIGSELAEKPDCTSDDWEKWENKMWKEVDAVIEGNPTSE